MTDKEKIRAELTRRINERLLWIKEYPRSKIIAIWEALSHEDESMLRYVDSLPEESVSEDLEEAWRAAYDKEKDEILVVYDHHAGFVAGADWKEQLMMKDAVEGKVISYEGISFPVSNEIHRLNLNEGDKVKMIIVKE